MKVRLSKREGDRERGICELTHLGLLLEIIASAGEWSVWCLVVCSPLLPSPDISPVLEGLGVVLGGAGLAAWPGVTEQWAWEGPTVRDTPGIAACLDLLWVCLGCWPAQRGGCGLTPASNSNPR